MRICVYDALGVELYVIQQVQGTPACLVSGHTAVGLDGVVYLSPDAQHRVEGIERRLEDHRTLTPAEVTHFSFTKSEHVVPLAATTVHNLTLADGGRFDQQPDQRQPERRLAAAALANQRQALTLTQVEIHAAHGFYRTSRDLVLHP